MNDNISAEARHIIGNIANLNVGANGRWLVIGMAYLLERAGQPRFALLTLLILGAAVLIEQMPQPYRWILSVATYVWVAILAGWLAFTL